MIFFDLDGTLFKTHLTSLPPLRRLSKQYGILLNAQMEREYLCLTTEAFLTMAAPTMSASDKLAFRDALWTEELNEIRANARLFPGMKRVLKRLFDAGVLLAVCTMSGSDYVAEVLKKTNIAHYFRTLLTRVEGKTKSTVLREYLEAHPDDFEGSMLIGDSWVDEEAAKANKMPFLCMTHGYDPTRRSNDVRRLDNAMALWGEISRIRLFQQIEHELSGRQGRRVIGVSGIDTSGKTAFSSDLARYFKERGFPTERIGLDDFHQPSSIRRIDDSPEGYLRNAFDLNALHAFLTSAFATSGRHERACLDLNSDAYAKQLDVEPSPETIWIVEGVALFRPPLDHLFLYRVYLDVTFEEAFRRAETRDVPQNGKGILERYEKRYFPAQKLFLERYLSQTACDMIVDNEDIHHPTRTSSIRYLQAHNPRFAVFRLAVEDMKTEWLDGFNRHQIVKRMCFVNDGKLSVKNANFTEDWGRDRLREIERGVLEIVKRGGKAVAAYVGDQVIGFACVEPEMFGDGTLNLNVIHVSEESRGIGVGKALFMAIAEEARYLGGKRLYISAHPSVESQAFYRTMGCVLAKTIHPELYALEPEDIHMEYNLQRDS